MNQNPPRDLLARVRVETVSSGTETDTSRSLASSGKPSCPPNRASRGPVSSASRAFGPDPAGSRWPSGNDEVFYVTAGAGSVQTFRLNLPKRILEAFSNLHWIAARASKSGNSCCAMLPKEFWLPDFAPRSLEFRSRASPLPDGGPPSCG